MRKIFSSFLALLFIASVVSAQDTLKVMDYNLLKYGISMSGCTNPIATKNIYLKTIIESALPDIFVVNEIGTNSLYADNILVNVMQVVNPAYQRAAFTDDANSDETNMLYYDSDKLGLRSQSVIAHSLRDINFYTLYYKDANLATTQDTIFIHIIGVHLKAGSTGSDQSQRLNQAQLIMTFMGNQGDPGNYLVMGDFNIQSSTEGCYQEFVAASNLDIRLYDPINSPGSWNNNSSFAGIHTQSTRTASESDCGSNGGMDDRFDFILATDYVMQGTDRVTYVPGSYGAMGQDGLRFNQTITSPANTLVNTSVANALYGMSDHLPVILKLKVAGTQVKREAILASSQASIFVHQVETLPGDNLKLLVESNQLNRLNFNLVVRDVSGKIVQEVPVVVNAGSQEIMLESSSFSRGVYFCSFISEKGERIGLRVLMF